MKQFEQNRCRISEDFKEDVAQIPFDQNDCNLPNGSRDQSLAYVRQLQARRENGVTL